MKSDGIAWSVGYNGSGQLGDGTTISRSNPVQVMDSNGSPFSNVRKLGTGSSHSIFVKGDGSAWSAGWNNMGQLGDGSTISRSNPVQVVDAGGSSLTNTISASGGMWHSMILKSDGTMASFGRNNYGQLGDGTLVNRSNPVQVLHDASSMAPFPQFSIKVTAAGSYHTVYLKGDGTVWASGLNSNGQLGDGTTTQRTKPVHVMDGSGNPLSGILGISAGEGHTVYLKGDGTVLAGGRNDFGQLGDGTTTQRTKPVQVMDGSGNPLSGVVGIYAGEHHTVYLKGDGTVWASGFNSDGQLGDGTTTDRTNPVQVMNGSGNPLSGVVGISAGETHTVYLQGDGTVWAVGCNFDGRLGDGTTLNRTNPVQVLDGSGNPLSGVVGIYAGECHTVFLKGDDTVLAAGDNGNGQLGDGTTTNRSNPVQVVDGSGNPLSGVVGISAGEYHTVYLKGDGTVWAAGRNHFGQMGDGTTTNRTNPVPVVDGSGNLLSGVVGISAGYSHTAYLKGNGTVWAVGSNTYGQLGNETTTDITNPVQVLDGLGNSLSGVVGISAAFTHTVYLKSGGTVLAAGRNDYGQLGDGTTTYRSNPIQVVDGSGNPLIGMVGVAAGSSYTVYLKGDGTVWAAGRNHFGQLGDGTTTNRTNPVQVLDESGNPLSGVVGVSAGVNHTVYLKGDGTVWAVGHNADGRLGDGTTTQRTNPVQVVDGSGNPLSGVVGISAGQHHTVYLKGDGTVWGAGGNNYGQLGDGSSTDRSNPVQVVDGSGNPLSGVVGISVGGFHTVYFKGDGTVWAVGRNNYGQLGDGTTTNRSNPVQVVDGSGNPLSGVVGISAGGDHTVYLQEDGTLWAVGSNSSGQLGDGTTSNRSNSIPVYYGVKRLMETPYNHSPMLLSSLGSLTIAENQPVGTMVGEFNATDRDPNTVLTYSLVSGAGDGNNSLFTMESNGSLKTASLLDYESGENLSIRVQVKDEYNATSEEIFTVTLQDLFEDTDGDGFRDSLETTIGSDLSDSNSTPLQYGIFAWYPLDGNASDISGNLRDGVVQGATLTTNRDGELNKAYNFNGINDRITVSGAWFDGNQKRTISFWALSSSGGGNFFTLGEGTANNRFSLLSISDNSVKFVGESNDHDFSTSSYFNKWKHFVLSYDGNEGELYLNAKSAGSFQKTLDTDADASLVIGSNSLSRNNEFFNGSIDDVRIYDRALTITEITKLYVLEGNKPPTNLNSLETLSIDENLPLGSVVGELNATDPNGDIINYSLVSGEGDSHNHLFTLEHHDIRLIPNLEMWLDGKDIDGDGLEDPINLYTPGDDILHWVDKTGDGPSVAMAYHTGRRPQYINGGGLYFEAADWMSSGTPDFLLGNPNYDFCFACRRKYNWRTLLGNWRRIRLSNVL